MFGTIVITFVVLSSLFVGSFAAYWESAGTGDCAGNDFGYMGGVLYPQANICTEGTYLL